MLDYFIVRQRDVPCRHIFSLSFHFNITSVTDTTITNSDIPLDFDLPILNYNFEYVPTPLSAGVWVCILITVSSISLLKELDETSQALWITIHFTNKRDIICRVINKFLTYFHETLERLSISGKSIYIMTDANINLLHYEACK